MARFFAALIVLVVAGYLLVGRGRYYHPASRERSDVGRAAFADGFSVAVVWPPERDMSFVHGVRLALEELDARRTALSGKIRLRIVDEERDEDAKAVAQRVVSYDDVVAVIGHEYSGSAIPASVVYEQHGLLFVAATSTAPRLTAHGFRFVFRLTPDDRVIATALASFAQERGIKAAGVIYSRTETGESAAGQIVSHLREANVRVPFVRSFMPRARDLDFRPLIAELRREPLDAVFVADEMPRAAAIVVDLSRMGYTGPILGIDKLDTREIWTRAGGAANNLFVASAADPAATTPAYLEFRRRFRTRWGNDPAYAASQGYDAMNLLINAIAVSRSADPVTVATTLHTRAWPALFGDYTFNDRGDVVGRMISIKRQLDGTFRTVEQWKETQ